MDADESHEQLIESIHMRSRHKITIALQNGADVNKITTVRGINQVSAAHREAVQSKCVNVVVHLLEHGASVDNERLIWDNAISNQQSTEIFRRLFTTLKTQIHAQPPHLGDGVIVEHVWKYLNKDSDCPIEHNIAIHGTPAMLSMAIAHGMQVDIPDSIPVVYALFGHMKCNYRRDDYRTVGPDFEEKTRIILALGTRKFPVPTGHLPLLNMAIAIDTSWNGDLVRICLDDRYCENVNHEQLALGLDEETLPTEQTTTLGHLIAKDYRNGVQYLATFNNIFVQLMEAGANPVQMSNGCTPILLAVQACERYSGRGVVMSARIDAVKDILA